MKDIAPAATSMLILFCTFAAVSVCPAYSPLMWIDPSDPTCDSFSFELQGQGASDGLWNFTLKVTIFDREFNEGVSLGLCSILDPDGESHRNTKGWRILSFTLKDRTITCKFTLTEDESNDKDMAFVFSEPVIVIHNGKIWHAPNVSIYFGWISDFLDGTAYSKQVRFERVKQAIREPAAESDDRSTPLDRTARAPGAPQP